MTVAADKVVADINRYIDAMRDQGKMPSVVYITQQQYNDLEKARNLNGTKNWKPRIRTIPIEVRK